MRTEKNSISLTDIWRQYGRPSGKKPHDFFRRGPGGNSLAALAYLLDEPVSGLVEANGFGTWTELVIAREYVDWIEESVARRRRARPSDRPDDGQPCMGDSCFEFLVAPDYPNDFVGVAC